MKLNLKSLINKFWKIRKHKKSILLNELLSGSSITLLDIGSAEDIQPRWLPIANKLNYIGVEPDQRSASLLKNIHNCKNYKIINSVIWSDKQEITFNLCKRPLASSVFKPNRDLVDRFPDSDRFEIINKKSFKSSTLDDELGNIKVDFVKLDIQGGELSALKGMENHLSSCLGLEIEVEFSPIYEKQPLFGELCNFLNKAGFEFIDFTSLHRWERDALKNYGQCTFGDGLWLRNPEDIIKNHAHKYVEYISICSIFGRFDLIKTLINTMQPKLSVNNKIALRKLMKNQKNTRNFHRLFNYLIKIISAEDPTSLHLIY